MVRPCSITPAQLLLSYALVVAFSSGIAAWFGWHGIWPVPLFCLLVVLVAVCMYLSYMTHACDGEEVTLKPDGEITVDVIRGLETRRYRMQATWLRGERCRGRLWLCYGRDRVEVGTQLGTAERRRFENELRRAIACRVFAKRHAGGVVPGIS
jgi:uncharacterized membrane protein